MARADYQVGKLLRDVVDNPENVSAVLEIIKSNPKQQVSEWIAKQIFHHRNFDTPEKCEIMRDIIYHFISIGLMEQRNTAALYTAEVCMMPLEGKERSRTNYREVDTEEKVRMHEKRAQVIGNVFDRLEEEGLDIRGNERKSGRTHRLLQKDPKTEELIIRVRKGIRNRHHALGLTPPKRFRIKRWRGNLHRA
jgi:hypothetical protein